ncbi:MAG TPA: ornithine carbamoyltransferase [Candidatus Dormibacteraeota bacterium]
MSSSAPSADLSLDSLRGRDYLHVRDLTAEELAAVLDLALAIKAGGYRGRPLQDRHVAMLFQRPSHRTRVSFEVGIGRLGGRWTTLSEQDVQLGVRESVADAARVLDRYVDLIVGRLKSQAALDELAGAADVPVVNALTEESHPCQILADLLTLREIKGRLDGVRLAYVGDGNNISNSLAEAAQLTGLDLVVIGPPGYHPARIPNGVEVTDDLARVQGADAVYTDVWASMGHEEERSARLEAFRGYQVNAELMAGAPQAVFLHCLPAHRGEEVTDEVIDGPASRVFQQAENRLYAQMALMAALMGAGSSA